MLNFLKRFFKKERHDWQFKEDTADWLEINGEVICHGATYECSKCHTTCSVGSSTVYVARYGLPNQNWRKIPIKLPEFGCRRYEHA